MTGSVMPRPVGYRNAIAMYIRVENPHICTLSISVLSGIIVRKHNDKIRSNYIVQV